jgi:hypothetical protein
MAVVMLGCWGIIAYAFYQWQVCGDPLAFVNAQAFWRLRVGGNVPLADKGIALG